MKDERTYIVFVEEDTDGSYFATVDALPGCFASGATEDEALDNLSESVGLYLSTDDVPVEVQQLSRHRREDLDPVRAPHGYQLNLQEA